MPWLCLDKWLILGKSIFSEVLFYLNIIRIFGFSYFNFSFFGSHLEIFATFFCVYSFQLKNICIFVKKLIDMRKITVLDKHIQRAKKRDWMQSHRLEYDKDIQQGNFTIPMRVVVETTVKACYKWTKNNEND